MSDNISVDVQKNNTKESAKISTSQIDVSVVTECTPEVDINNINKSETSKNMEKLSDEKNKFLYEKAIEGRMLLHQNFNHWMNMYAIFNGAFFVAFYLMKAYKAESEFLPFMILLLGCVVGWFWYFSIKDYYKWILSWMGVVAKYETQYVGNDKNSFVYRLFMTNESSDKPIEPLSTQKLTTLFSFVVAISWTILEIWQTCRIFGFIDIVKNKFTRIKYFIYGFLFLFVAVFIIFVYVNKKWKESNLRDSHQIEPFPEKI